jgi:hypothetical protein
MRRWSGGVASAGYSPFELDSPSPLAAGTNGDRDGGRRRRDALILVLLSAWLVFLIRNVRSTGLFYRIGIDYAINVAATRAFLAEGPASLYELDAVTRHLAPFAAYYGPDALAINAGVVPYPPVMALSLVPFALLPPVVGFVLWLLLSASAAGYAVWTLTRPLGRDRVRVALIALLSVPLAYGIVVGQFTAFYVLFLLLAYRRLQQGQDFRAGIWLGLLLVKPQLIVAPVLVLLYKRRCGALFGVLAVGVILGVSSFVVLGRDGAAALLASWHYFSGFRAVHPSVYPPEFANWHGLLVVLLPELGESAGFLWTTALSILTFATLPIIWRGTWEPADRRFGTRFLATVVASLLGSYHGYIHGLALLIVPGLAAAAQPSVPRVVGWALRLGVLGTGVLLMLSPPTLVPASLFSVVLMVGILCATVVSEVKHPAGAAKRPGAGAPLTHAERSPVSPADHPARVP